MSGMFLATLFFPLFLGANSGTIPLNGTADACLRESRNANSGRGDYTFLYNYLTGTGVHNFSESVTIGFLGAYGQAQVVLGALPLAVEAVNQNKGEYALTSTRRYHRKSPQSVGITTVQIIM